MLQILRNRLNEPIADPLDVVVDRRVVQHRQLLARLLRRFLPDLDVVGGRVFVLVGRDDGLRRGLPSATVSINAGMRVE